LLLSTQQLHGYLPVSCSQKTSKECTKTILSWC
jgi:hypothetical protein